MQEGKYQPNPDWTEAEVSGIPEETFPVRCDRCGHQLTGLGERGRCPECLADFDRRALLWAAHGPEAFASPPIDENDHDDTPADRRFVVGVVTAFLGVIALVVTMLVWRALFGYVDFVSSFVAWLVVLACAEWIIAARAERDERDADHDEDPTQ